MLRFGCDDNDFGSSRAECKSLRGNRDIDVERFGFGCWAARASGLNPQVGSQPECFMSERKVASWRRIDESIQPADPERLIRPRSFALKLVVDDCRRHDTLTIHR